MSRKRKQHHANHERWLVSYADFITLLFAFFVVLYSSSQVDRGKMLQLAAAIESGFHKMGVFQGSAPGPPANTKRRGDGSDEKATAAIGRSNPQDTIAIAVPPNAIQPNFDQNEIRAIKEKLEKALASEIKDRSVTLRPGPEGLVISLSELGFFDSGSAEMRPDARPAFARIAKILVDRQFNVRVEGHTDNVPIRTAQFQSNWDLSIARAVNLIKLLISQHDCPAERLSAAGYAEYHPVASNSTAEGRKQNRRVDMVILTDKQYRSASQHSRAAQ